LQDYELIKRIKQGDRALFGQLAERYYDDVFRYCYYQTGNEQAAYDCTQETFCHLIRFLDNYTERHHFKSYLLRIALNVCRDHYRRNGREVICGDLTENMEEISSVSSPPDHDAEEEIALKLMIQEGLMTLPGYQREVIILYYYQSYKLREIASLTGVPLSTVKTRLRAGTEKLREYFQEKGGFFL